MNDKKQEKWDIIIDAINKRHYVVCVCLNEAEYKQLYNQVMLHLPKYSIFKEQESHSIRMANGGQVGFISYQRPELFKTFNSPGLIVTSDLVDIELGKALDLVDFIKQAEAEGSKYYDRPEDPTDDH